MKLNNKLSTIILFVLCLLGFVVRLYKINSPIADWHSWRQADTASVTRIFVDEGINIFAPKYYDISSIQSGSYNPEGYRSVEFPIYNYFHALLVKAFPLYSLEKWGRLLSSSLSIISAVLIYFIGKRFLGNFGGLLSSFFYLFIPFNIYFSRVILPEPIGVTCGLFFLLFFILYFDTKKMFYLFIASGFLSLAMLIKPQFAFYSLPAIYLYFSKNSFQSIFSKSYELVKLMLAVLIIFLPFFLWRVVINQHPAGIPYFTWAFNGDGIRFRPAFFRWIFGERIGRMILGIWGLPFLFLGFLWGRAKSYFINLMFIGSIVYLSVFATASVRHDYYQYLIIPSICLSLAQGIVFVFESKMFDKLTSLFTVSFCVGLMLFIGFYQIKDFYQVNHPEIIEAGEAINRLTPKDARVIAPYNGDTAFLYHTKRYGWPAVDTSFSKLINERSADYYVSVNIGDSDTQNLIKKYKTIEKTDRYIILDLHQPL